MAASLPVEQLRGAMGAAARKVESFVRGNAKFQAAVEDAFNKVGAAPCVAACVRVCVRARMCVRAHASCVLMPQRRSAMMVAAPHAHACMRD